MTLDHVSLKELVRRPDVGNRATWRIAVTGVRLLWEVCQIPDFRKTVSTEAHVTLLSRIYRVRPVGGDTGVLTFGVDRRAGQVRIDRDRWRHRRADRSRLAFIRTWTYVANRGRLARSIRRNGGRRTREVEDRLSDALHERLTQRFIDRRTQALLKSLRDGGSAASIEADGALMFDGDRVGQIDGLRYALAPSGADLEKRALGLAAKRVLGPEMRRRAKALVDAADGAFALDDQGQILWRMEVGSAAGGGSTAARPDVAGTSPGAAAGR